MPSPDLPGVPDPVRTDVRAIPVLNPLLLVAAGLIYGIVLAVLLSVVWGLAVFTDVPAPPLSLHTAGILWLVGVVLAIVRDALRKRRMSIAVYPGWIVRSFGSNTVRVPRDEVTRVRVRTSSFDRLAGTKTIDVFDADGHRLRLPRVRDPATLERALSNHISEEL